MAGMSHVEAQAGVKKGVYADFSQAVLELLDSGEKVMIQGFGTFERKISEARTGRNPATGESVAIPAKSKIHFKAGKDTVQVIVPKKKSKK